ncbi:MAG TPA: hotdog fold domain-containing protein [Gemmatimonadales bacterium]|jgi:acyl-coenzyme A thioesterase PaaI-like protein|nr:hotdog fold domain-containing protein [Gemmatimonadales bacterium]
MTPSDRVSSLWRTLHDKPGGTWLFSRLLGRVIPYSSTTHPHIRELRPGYARLTMKDRRSVRNHLNSIHAIAIANLGELTSGLAMVPALPPGARGIVTAFAVEYFKKARGNLEAVCSCQPPAAIGVTTEVVVQAEIRDEAGDIVARTAATWRLGPA